MFRGSATAECRSLFDRQAKLQDVHSLCEHCTIKASRPSACYQNGIKKKVELSYLWLYTLSVVQNAVLNGCCIPAAVSPAGNFFPIEDTCTHILSEDASRKSSFDLAVYL